MKHLIRKTKTNQSFTFNFLGISCDSLSSSIKRLYTCGKTTAFAFLLFIFTFSNSNQLLGQGDPGCFEIVNPPIVDDGNCYCSGSIIFSVRNFTPPLRYKVFKDEVLMNDWVTINDPIIELRDLCNGTYRFKIDDGTLCSELCPVWNINGPSSPLNVEIENECDWERQGCNGSWTVDGIATGGTSPYTYKWTSDQTGSTVLSSNSRVVATQAGTYRLTITDANDCVVDDYVYVGPLEILPPTIIDADCNSLGEVNIETKGGLLDCDQCSTPIFYVYLYKIDPSTGNQLDWEVTNLPEITPDYLGTFAGSPPNFDPPYPKIYRAATKRNFSIKKLPPGKYKIQLGDDPPSPCEDYLEFEIKEDIPVVDLVTLPIDCTTPNTGSVISTVTGGKAPYTYEWLKDGVIMNGESGSSINNLSEGTYTVKVTDDEGCIATKDIVLNPVLSLTSVDFKPQRCFLDVNGNFRVRVGTELPITAGTGPYTFVWSHSSAPVENHTTILPGQTVTLTITDVNGCTETFTITAKTCGSFDDDAISKTCTIFPNPTTGIFTARITINEAPQETDVKVVDINQNSYFTQNLGILSVGQHDVPIDISSAPAGTYHLIINNGELSIAVVKN